MKRRLRMLAALLLAGVSTGCDRGDGPYLAIEGGGFVYNYRIGEFFYGVSVAPLRRLPEGGQIVATFDNPAGGAAFSVSEAVRAGQMRYGLRTPALQGVRQGVPYAVVVTLRGADGTALFRIERAYRSTIDQASVPNRPLTLGPGYAPVPFLPPTASH